MSGYARQQQHGAGSTAVLVRSFKMLAALGSRQLLSPPGEWSRQAGQPGRRWLADTYLRPALFLQSDCDCRQSKLACDAIAICTVGLPCSLCPSSRVALSDTRRVLTFFSETLLVRP